MSDGLKNLFIFLVIFLVIFFLVFLLFFFNKDYIYDYFSLIESNEWNLISKDRLLGVGVVVDQLTNYNSYYKLISLFPTDYRELYLNPDDKFGNEITYFLLTQIFGLFYFIYYLFNLLKFSNLFIFLICVTLIHYADITSPFFIMLLIQYTIKFNNESNISKK